MIAAALGLSDKLLSFDDTQPCDAALVLAGEEQHRVDKGIRLIERGYTKHLFVDVPEGSGYGRPYTELARDYLLTKLQPEQFTVCVVVGDSTLIEAREVGPCLGQVQGVRSVLLVTHDFHSRRALMSFRQMLRGYDFHVSAVRERYLYQPHWWHTRENVKYWLTSMTKMLWYLIVERWLVMLHWM